MLILLMGISPMVTAQPTNVPQVGNPFPDITFQNVRNYKKKEFVVSEQKGKWLFINVWNLGCTSCFKLFKKIKEIEDNIGNKVSFLQVGIKDNTYNANIESIYQRISTNMKLQVPATIDSTLSKLWGIDAYPQLFVIDPGGTLRFITDGRDLTVDKVKALLNNEPVAFYPSTAIVFTEFDVSAYTDNKHVKMTTIISEATGEAQSQSFEIFAADDLPSEIREKGWSISVATLRGLYNCAYFGREFWSRSDTVMYAKTYPYPILEMKDTTRFSYDFSATPPVGTYNCFIKLPAEQATPEAFMRALQHGLKQTFGYTVAIETREIPVWHLIAKPGAAETLRTKGGTPFRTPGSSAGGFVLRNRSMNDLLRTLTGHLLFDRNEMTVDATGIKTNIDFEMIADMTDFNIVQREIEKQGLTFVKRPKTMQVLIVRD